MARRALQFVLVASLLYWASGLGRFVHERMEHDAPSVAAATVNRSVTTAGHSEDDCPVCQALATMRADRPVVTVVPIGTFERIGSFISSPQAAPVSERLLTIHSRGPPPFSA